MARSCASATLLKALRQPSCRVRNSFYIPQLRRSYYSVHHPDAPPYPESQDRILSAAMKHVPKLGFCEEALIQGAKDAGYLEASVQLFPRGVFDLINYHLVTQRLALKDKVKFPEGLQLGLGAKVKTLTMARLRGNAEIIKQWQGALGYMSLLENMPASLQELAALSDEIWYLAGDTAVDFSYYTKRASLSAVYASSEVFMTTDKSQDFVATEEFLDRRLRAAQGIGGTVGGLTQYVGFWAGNSVNLARSWGMRV
ncbi:Ubiquinone biosynthesis protein coq9, mitochondrial [Exophiala dermatitidis]|nr:Ubiquinone biosynthesis protein coq9, mitochondrial [Exophiala dermatitidis]KAJ4510300.1 Ubiquinone biosynthesis protein coq9, mitochondrial [Exophiala dermatitidis]KAJ4510766.1 Ubiquinone biosynthesis protein coq9, mitochondrial [Exophiala dermatitidis]KAJ4534903.1 Ubiquinone biosynthesis protein coq9, mitochondrial [Exophiala dermatitidis]KAJ4535973.1 Ubiquinone biosynthesis protein coq9, mitochondrial [Exophiala dermatitidis]